MLSTVQPERPNPRKPHPATTCLDYVAVLMQVGKCPAGDATAGGCIEGHPCLAAQAVREVDDVCRLAAYQHDMKLSQGVWDERSCHGAREGCHTHKRVHLLQRCHTSLCHPAGRHSVLNRLHHLAEQTGLLGGRRSDSRAAGLCSCGYQEIGGAPAGARRVIHEGNCSHTRQNNVLGHLHEPGSGRVEVCRPVAPSAVRRPRCQLTSAAIPVHPAMSTLELLSLRGSQNKPIKITCRDKGS